MRRNVVFYRLMAYITGVVLIVLCVLAVAQPNGAAVHAVGLTHGMLYIVYLAAAWMLARRLKLARVPTVLMLLAGTIPVLTFVVERHVSRQYIEPAMAAAAQPSPVAGPARTAG